ncbi:MAG: DUF4912 domain-containing protein [Nitrospirota bacterium]
MKKQKTTKKGILKAKAAKKAESKLEKKELIRVLSGKPSKQKKKTPAKKAARTKKAVTPKKAIKKITAKKIKAVPKKPEKKVKTEKAKPATAKKKTAKKTIAKAVLKKPAKKAAVKEAPKKAVKKPSAKKVAKPAVKKAVKPQKKEIKKPLEELTIAELKTLAKELNIALKSGLKKADIIKAMGKAKAEKKPRPEKPKKKVAKKEKVVVEMPPLPVSYGESKLASMPVTPRQVYAYWEITEDTISKYEGSLNLKVINTKTNAFFYTPISERIGEQFISVSPATEYTVELGVINYKGEFVRILKSLPVETPVVGIAPAEVKEEAPQAGGLPEEFFETPESISSY